MKTMLEHLSKLSDRILKVEEVAEVTHRRRGGHKPDATPEKRSGGGLVRKGLPALVIGYMAVAGLRRHRARQQGK